MSKPSSPPPPDYNAAAEASQYNQVTPFGSVTWTNEGAQPGYWAPAPTGTGSTSSSTSSNYTYDPYATSLVWGVEPSGDFVPPGGQPMTSGDQMWVPGTEGTRTATMTLTPELQSAVDSINQQIASGYSQPMDLQSVEDVQNEAYGAFTSRLDPMWQQKEQAEIQRLANQGVVPGSEAYTNAMRDFSAAENDAYNQAILGSIQTMPQTYQLAQAQYMQPLNTLNALRSGAQVQTPFFTPGSDALAAANAQGQYQMGQYGNDVSTYNAMMAGLFGIGAAMV